MNPLTLKSQLIILGVTVLLTAMASGYAGWRVKGAFVAERDLAIVEAKKEFTDAFRENEQNVAGILEDKFSQLRANEKVINNEILKIIDRPVYLNECLDADGLSLIERARTGKASAGESTEEVRTAK